MATNIISTYYAGHNVFEVQLTSLYAELEHGRIPRQRSMTEMPHFVIALK